MLEFGRVECHEGPVKQDVRHCARKRTFGPAARGFRCWQGSFPYSALDPNRVPPSYHIYATSVSLLSEPCRCFSWVFPSNIMYAILISPHACYMSHLQRCVAMWSQIHFCPQCLVKCYLQLNCLSPVCFVISALRCLATALHLSGCQSVRLCNNGQAVVAHTECSGPQCTVCDTEYGKKVVLWYTSLAVCSVASRCVSSR
jgi:hypothetical protein